MAQIVVSGIHKFFQVNQSPIGTLPWWQRLRRTRTRLTAFEDILFSVEPGELIGYIGPNGAEKSTTVIVMSGILVPKQGTPTFHHSSELHVKADFGLVPVEEGKPPSTAKVEEY